ncbi:MAG: GrpB family protein [Brevundimonas sp.]
MIAVAGGLLTDWARKFGVPIRDHTLAPPSQIELVQYDHTWAGAYAEEAERLQRAIRNCLCFVDHVGSTAIPGLPAKPVIDLLVTLPDWSAVGVVSRELQSQGYLLRQRVRGRTPRRFMTRLDPSGGPAFNLHLVPPKADWGLRMLAFRDALLADKALVRRYAALKQELANLHPENLAAYTRGKATFVGNAVLEIEGAFSTTRLLTHQRAELDRAQQLQVILVLVQLLMAGVAAGSVFSSDGETLLALAVLGFALAVAWFELGRRSGCHRRAGNQARRLVLLASGLGQTVSPEQRLRIFDGFAIPIRGHPPVREEAYFSSRCRPSHQRAAELIEESAYWTRDLQKTSARVVGTVLGLIALGLCIGAWRGVVDLTGEAQINVARVMIAALVFVLSSDVLGALLGHRQAARAIDEILQRIETTSARGYQEADVLLLMSDYNAAVESAPVVLPLIYGARRRTLSQRWRSYLAAKAC